MRRLIGTLSVLVFVTSCSHSVRLMIEEPDCSTSLEGFYACLDNWRGPRPALIYRDRGELSIAEGAIVSLDSDGVLFDQNRQSVLFDPEPKYYKFSEIEALIDSAGVVVAGSIPQALSNSMALELTLKSEKKLSLTFEPNKQFAFCLPPGLYRIDRMQLFGYRKYHQEQSKDLPILLLNIEQGVTNYLGTLCLDTAKGDPVDSLSVKWKDMSKKAYVPFGVFGPGLAAAAVAGAAQGLALYATRPGSSPGTHEFFICIDRDFRPLCKSSLKQISIEVREE